MNDRAGYSDEPGEEALSRAFEIEQRYSGLIYRNQVVPNWLEGDSRFWYKVQVDRDRDEYVLADIDNRMDKIWWNEQWMGWPVDESYADSSNVVDAHRLQGKLLLIVGELDSNVDPASTYQVVHALQQSNKSFDFVPIIGAGHGAAESSYGKRLRAAFLLQHLHSNQRKQ